MKKKISFVLSILLILQALTLVCFADGIQTITEPTVFISGREQYNIVWVTDEVCAAYVEITAGGKKYTYADERDGILKTDDYIHTVRVDKSVLDRAKSYTVITKAVDQNDADGIVFGAKTQKSFGFKPYSNQKKIKFAFFSDTHSKVVEYNHFEMGLKTLKQKVGACDVIVLNGDISDSMASESYFTETLLYISNKASNGSLPVVYARGNHEARGVWAQYLADYIGFDNGTMYGEFDYGPVSALVADCGEDKSEQNIVYGGLTDFENYMQEQYNYFENLGGYTEGATYKVAISHSPRIFDSILSNEIAEVLDGYGTDIAIGGHTHTASVFNQGENYPTLTDGGINGANDYRVACMEFENGSINFNVYNSNGANVLSYKTEAKNQPKSYIKYEGISKDDSKIEKQQYKGSSDLYAAVLCEPTVFDCGDNYNIVYMVDASSEFSKAEVVVIKDGMSYTFKDSVSGNAVSKSLHSVAVPKDLLEGATYYIKTTYLGDYGAYGPEIHHEGSYTKIEATIVSKEYKFLDYSDKNQINIASFSNFSQKSTEIANSITVNPDVIVATLNATEGLYSENDFFDSVLTFTSPLSRGTTPVILVRGDGFEYGDWAARLGSVLRVKKNGKYNGLYFTTSYGDVTLAVCDTPKGASARYITNQIEYFNNVKVKSGTVVAVAKDEQSANDVIKDNLQKLGVSKVITAADGFGYFVKCKDNKIMVANNNFAGTQDGEWVEITAKPEDARLLGDNKNVIHYKTDTIKQRNITDETKTSYQESFELGWYEHTLYVWSLRGLDITLKAKPGVSEQSACDLAIALANILGVNYDKLEGTNIQNKAIDFNYNAKILTFLPPVMHTFNKQDITDIIDKLK